MAMRRYMQRRSYGPRAAPGGTARGGKREKIVKKSSRENSDCKFRMCWHAIKTKQFPKPKMKGRQI